MQQHINNNNNNNNKLIATTFYAQLPDVSVTTATISFRNIFTT